MKKSALLIISCILLILCACTQQQSEHIQQSSGTQIIANAVKATLHSEDFESWQNLYRDFTSQEPAAPEIAAIMHYQIDDFEGEPVDCYLVDINADVAYWVNQEEARGATENHFQIFIDSNSGTTYDSMTLNSVNFDGDVSTDEGRANYLLWILSQADGGYNIIFLNENETLTMLTEDEVQQIKDLISE